jgi:hypothetical protein
MCIRRRFLDDSIGYSVGSALLLMSNNWAESGLESGQKPISLSSNLPVSLTMQHTVAGVGHAGSIPLPMWLPGYIRESVSLV